MALSGRQPSGPDPPAHYVDTTIKPAGAFQKMGEATANQTSHPSITPIERLATQMSMPLVTSISGAISGIASGVVTCPLDVIKTKLQAQGGFRTEARDRARAGGSSSTTTVYRGLVGTAASIWRDEGVRGMYRGLFPMVLGYFPTWAVYFTVYDRAKVFWYEQLDPDRSGRRKLLAHLLTSVTAGACSTIITNPIWVIKTRLMSQASGPGVDGMVNGGGGGDGRPPWHYRSTWDAARKMYLHEGLGSFYSGLTPALLGLTHVAVQFPLYEYLKFQFTGLEMGQDRRQQQQQQQSGMDDGGLQHQVDHGSGSSSHWMGMCIATVLSKICASTATYPHEVLRTRLQTQQRHHHHHHHPSSQEFSRHHHNDAPRYRGIVQTVQTILREEGWRAFYVGMGTNMIRAVPAAATTILTYEYVVGRIKKLQAEAVSKVVD